METLKAKSGFKILFNGSKTYCIVDVNNDCWFSTDTLRKAENRFNKILTQSGLI